MGAEIVVGYDVETDCVGKDGYFIARSWCYCRSIWKWKKCCIIMAFISTFVA